LRPALAADGLVAVEHRESQIFDVHTDPVAHDEHQDHGAEQGQGRSHRIAAQLKRFTAAVAKQALHAKRLARRHAFGFVFYRGNRRGFRIRRLGGICCFLQPGDKRLFKAGRSALFDQRLRRIAGQHFSGMHQRNAIAAFRFIHKVGGDKNRYPVLAG